MRAHNIFEVFFVAIFALPAGAGEVQGACENALFKPIELRFREADENFNKIKSHAFPNGPEAQIIRKFYSSPSRTEANLPTDLDLRKANSLGIKDKKLRNKFLSFSSGAKRLKDPQGYKKLVTDLVGELIPESKTGLKWFLNLKDSSISFTSLRPAKTDEGNEVYGAFTQLRKTENGKFSIEIIFSNNESEPIPYLIPLIVHELHHAKADKEKIKHFENKQKNSELSIVEEAEAFDLQMSAYIDLARKHPSLFCDWQYVTWAYGDLPVPLSWTMASMEQEMKEGKFIYRYAKMGSYKDEKYLLNKEGTELRDDIKKKIKSLNLKFVK